MYCRYCGKKINDNERECKACGAYVGFPPTNVYAILGMIFSFLLSVLGIVFASYGLQTARKLGGEGETMSKVALVISIILTTVEVYSLVVYLCSMIVK